MFNYYLTKFQYAKIFIFIHTKSIFAFRNFWTKLGKIPHGYSSVLKENKYPSNLVSFSKLRFFVMFHNSYRIKPLLVQKSEKRKCIYTSLQRLFRLWRCAFIWTLIVESSILRSYCSFTFWEINPFKCWKQLIACMAFIECEMICKLKLSIFA